MHTDAPNDGNRERLLHTDTHTEKHYRIAELAALWAVGRETLRKIVMLEPGVIKIRMGRRKSHTTYSIPESVAQRIHNRLTSE